MKKILSAMASIVFLTTMLMVGLSVTTSAAGTVVYSQNFESGKTDSSWQLGEQQQGSYKIVDESGNHVCQLITNTGDADNGYFHYIFGPSVGDYFTYTIRVRPDNIKNPDFNAACICFRCQQYADGHQPPPGENECYMVQMWQWRADIGLKTYANLGSYRGSPDCHVFNENQDFTFDNGTWYTFRIEGRKNSFKAYVNNKLAVQFTDKDNYFKAGDFALTAWGANISVDDIAVTSYNSEAEMNGTATAATSTAKTSSNGTTKVTTGADTVTTASAASSTEPSVSETTASSSAESTDTTAAAISTTETNGVPVSGGSGGNNWILPAVIAAVAVIGAGVVAFLILQGKKQKKAQ